MVFGRSDFSLAGWEIAFPRRCGAAHSGQALAVPLKAGLNISLQ